MFVPAHRGVDDVQPQGCMRLVGNVRSLDVRDSAVAEGVVGVDSYYRRMDLGNAPAILPEVAAERLLTPAARRPDADAGTYAPDTLATGIPSVRAEGDDEDGEGDGAAYAVWEEAGNPNDEAAR